MTTPATIDREVETLGHIPAYLDMARLCLELSITERTVDAWVKKGTLPPPLQPDGPEGKRLWEWKTVKGYLAGKKPKMALSADEEARRVQDATKRAAHARH